jgi:hypothetical protein
MDTTDLDKECQFFFQSKVETKDMMSGIFTSAPIFGNYQMSFHTGLNITGGNGGLITEKYSRYSCAYYNLELKRITNI